MSVYNGLPYLSEAIESILAQTYCDFEFLIVNDASTDSSSDVLARYAEQDSRIRILTNERNGGLGFSLARGLKAASTVWVARMDADDIALPNRLEQQMAYLHKNPKTDILGTWANDIDAEGNILQQRRVPTKHDDIYRYIWTNPFIHSTVVFRREAILRVGSYPPVRSGPEDYDLWFRCAAEGLRFANLPVALLDYRFTRAQMIRSRKFLTSTMLIGWRGCWNLKASPVAFLGVTTPIIKLILPPQLETVGLKILKKLDPRSRLP